VDPVFVSEAVLQPTNPGGIGGVACITHVNIVAYQHDITTFQERPWTILTICIGWERLGFRHRYDAGITTGQSITNRAANGESFFSTIGLEHRGLDELVSDHQHRIARIGLHDRIVHFRQEGFFSRDVILDLMHDDATIPENLDDAVDLFNELREQVRGAIFDEFAGMFLNERNGRIGQKTSGSFCQFGWQSKIGNTDDNFLERAPLVMHFNLGLFSHVSGLLRVGPGCFSCQCDRNCRICSSSPHPPILSLGGLTAQLIRNTEVTSQAVHSLRGHGVAGRASAKAGSLSKKPNRVDQDGIFRV
jgi:hypothetical protein